MANRLIPFAIFALTLCSSANAEWRVTGALGGSFAQNSDLHIRQSDADFTAHDVEWTEQSFTSPQYWDIRVLYFPTKDSNIGYGLGVIHAKVYAGLDDPIHVTGTIEGTPVDENVPLSTLMSRFSISHGVNFIGFHVIGRQHWMRDEKFPEGRMEPYVGLAIGPVLNHPESTIRGHSYFDWDLNKSLGYQALTGVHYKITPKWGVFTEFKATQVSEDVPVGDGNATTTLKSLHATLGVSYSF